LDVRRTYPELWLMKTNEGAYLRQCPNFRLCGVPIQRRMFPFLCAGQDRLVRVLNAISVMDKKEGYSYVPINTINTINPTYPPNSTNLAHPATFTSFLTPPPRQSQNLAAGLIQQLIPDDVVR
jgi:hypothetical protein